MRCFVCVILSAAALVYSAAAASSAVVFLPEDPMPEEEAAARELAGYWEKLTGSPVEIVQETERQAKRPRYHRFGAWRPLPVRDVTELSFFVGETRLALLHAPLPANLDRDGFVMRGGRNQFFLRGASPVGTRFAVYRFLHRYGQVRWYWPTELGERVPPFQSGSLPSMNHVEAPDFLSRQWSNATRFTDDAWELKNMMGHRDRFHHDLHRIFTEVVFDLRPDFFIMLGGERIRPNDGIGGHNYQICFGNPDSALFAARKAAEFFDANPAEASFSLGMTDTEAICQCPDCQQWVDPDRTFRNRPDYSDLVFIFMNRAAEELSKTHPDKFLGCLAYHWAENVPSFPVHPLVMPYLTADRSQWHDESFRREDQDLMRRWALAGPERLGIYDYYYGSSFVIPRLFTGITKDSLEYAREVGIDGFFAEIYSTWSLDGPKAWLTSQLLWDVTADREQLLKEFYHDFFGQAAEPMRAFYEMCEAIWMNQGGPVFWLKFYFDFTQLELFPPEVCGQLRRLLDDAGERAASDQDRKRVALVSEGFRLTELYSEYYYKIKKSASQSEILDLEELMTTLAAALLLREELEKHYEEVILPNVLHRPTLRFEERARFLPGMKLSRLVERASALAHGKKERYELAQLVSSLAVAFPESRSRLVMEESEKLSLERLQNGSFENDALWIGTRDGLVGNVDYTPFSWRRETAEGTPRAFVLTDDVSRHGDFSLSARGTERETFFQRFSAKPGEVYRFSAWTKGKVSPGSRVKIQLSWRDAGGALLAEKFQSLDRLLPGSAEKWEELLVFGEAPPGTVQGYVSLSVRNQGPDDVVYFDEMSLKQTER